MNFSRVQRFISVLLICTFPMLPEDVHHHLLREALNLLPRESSFPFDSSHLVVIYSDFINTHPEIQARRGLQELGTQLYAFTISQSWPIYFNFEAHELLTRAYSRPGGQWVAYLVAAVLTHEAVHARGEPRESAALSKELKLDQFFYSHKKLPAQFDIGALAEQYRAALQEESGLNSSVGNAP